MAKRTRYTPKGADILVTGIAAGCSVEVAARAAGVTRRTAYTWRETHPELREKWDEAIDNCTDMLEAKIHELAMSGDTTSLIFLLKARKPEIYNPNLLIRKQMLQLGLERMRADMLAGVPTIEGVATASDIVRFYLPENHRADAEIEDVSSVTIDAEAEAEIEVVTRSAPVLPPLSKADLRRRAKVMRETVGTMPEPLPPPPAPAPAPPRAKAARNPTYREVMERDRSGLPGSWKRLG